MSMENERDIVKNEKKERLKESRIYQSMQGITQWMDRYYLDGVAGLVPVIVIDDFEPEGLRVARALILAVQVFLQRKNV